MAPQKRNQTADKPQTKPKEQKTKQRENNGIPKKGDSDKTSETLAKNLEAAVNAYEKGDDGRKAEMQNQVNVRQPLDQPDAMTVDDEKPPVEQNVKKEPGEGSMFVSKTTGDLNHPSENGESLPSDQKPSSDTEQDLKPASDNNQEKRPPPKVGFQYGLATPSIEAEDELDLVLANPVREIFYDGASENVGFARLAFGRPFDIERQGPSNAARFRFKRHIDGYLGKCLDDVSYGTERQLNGGKLYLCGDMLSIQGVAWQPLKGIDHYSSLAPRNWKQGSRTVRPPMRIMVKWLVKGEDGKAVEDKNGRRVTATRWEKRDAVWRCWEDERGHGGAIVLCEEELRLGDAVILEKGDTVSLCDFVILTAAYRCEERFKEWQSKQRPGRDRSPTPGLPLLNNNEKQPGSGESSDEARSPQHANNPEEAEDPAGTTH
ncbi:hypothetical protein MY4038_009644 [Beauveria bassiana]